ncbi:ABC transporter ATP-binding protein, partial [Symbiobacterium thermophilum]
REIFDIIRRLNEETKTTFLVVEQNAMVALSIAHYGYVMENGRIVLEGPVQTLLNNEDVKEFYLGLTGVGRKSYREAKAYKRRKRWLA